MSETQGSEENGSPLSDAEKASLEQWKDEHPLKIQLGALPFREIEGEDENERAERYGKYQESLATPRFFSIKVDTSYVSVHPEDEHYEEVVAALLAKRAARLDAEYEANVPKFRRRKLIGRGEIPSKEAYIADGLRSHNARIRMMPFSVPRSLLDSILNQDQEENQ